MTSLSVLHCPQCGADLRNQPVVGGMVRCACGHWQAPTVPLCEPVANVQPVVPDAFGHFARSMWFGVAALVCLMSCIATWCLWPFMSILITAMVGWAGFVLAVLCSIAGYLHVIARRLLRCR